MGRSIYQKVTLAKRDSPQLAFIIGGDGDGDESMRLGGGMPCLEVDSGTMAVVSTEAQWLAERISSDGVLGRGGG